MLWAFDFLPALDDTGKPAYPDPDASTSNVTRRPVAFQCRLIPRTEDIGEMIREEAQRAEDVLKEWERA